MGRIVLQVDIVEILSLAWDHPIVTGGLLLMFTPPFFPVVVFFSPLLISTALCAVALISVGHQIEATREREVADWNGRVVEGERISARTNARRRPTVPGDERWLDLVQGFEPGASVNVSESTLMNDMKEEGLKVEFREDEGGIGFIEEDYLDRQIEAFREYERSFSSKSNAKLGAGMPAFSSNARALEGRRPSMEMIEFPDEDGHVSAHRIPPLFLYNLKTGGTGTKKNFNRKGRQRPEAVSGAEDQSALPFGSFDICGKMDSEDQSPLPFGSFDISEKIDSVKGERDEHHRFERGRSAIPPAEAQVSPAVGLSNLSNVTQRNVSRRQSPIRRSNSVEMDYNGFNTPKGTTQPSPIPSVMNLNNVAERIVSRRQSPIRRDHSMEMDFDGFNNVKGAKQPSPIASVTNLNNFTERNVSRRQSPVRRDHFMEADFVGFNSTAGENRGSPIASLMNAVNVAERNLSRQESRRDYTLETDYVDFKPSAPEAHLGPVESMMNVNDAVERNVPRRSSIKHDYVFQGDLGGFQTTGLGDQDSYLDSNLSRHYSIQKDVAGSKTTGLGDQDVSVDSNLSRQGSINRDYATQRDVAGFQTTGLGGQDSYGDANLSRQGSINHDHVVEKDLAWYHMIGIEGTDGLEDSVRQGPFKPRSASKSSEGNGKPPTYNAGLRSHNAVIYNPGSESGSAAASEHQGQRKPQANRDRRMSTSRQKRRNLSRENYAKHPFQLDVRAGDDWNQIKFPYVDR